MPSDPRPNEAKAHIDHKASGQHPSSTTCHGKSPDGLDVVPRTLAVKQLQPSPHRVAETPCNLRSHGCFRILSEDGVLSSPPKSKAKKPGIFHNKSNVTNILYILIELMYSDKARKTGRFRRKARRV